MATVKNKTKKEKRNILKQEPLISVPHSTIRLSRLRIQRAIHYHGHLQADWDLRAPERALLLQRRWLQNKPQRQLLTRV